MFRRQFYLWTLILLALLLGSCSEEVTYIEEHITGPENLQTTVNDTLIFWGTYSGHYLDVARHSWDFNSDGAFDAIWTNSIENPAWASPPDDPSTMGTYYHYRQPGDYVATLQVTTVKNRMFRWLTYITITDELPEITVTAQDSAQCGEEFTLIGFASDDAGDELTWDYDGFDGPDIIESFADTMTFAVNTVFNEPGYYVTTFTATDNDENVAEYDHEILVGAAPEWGMSKPMTEARTDHASAVYNDRIYIFGGRHSEGVLGSVEVFNPVDSTWASAPDMPTARWGLQAVNIDDLIYVVGGVTPADTIFPRIEVFDPYDESWSEYPHTTETVIDAPRRGFSAERVGLIDADGTDILVYGGWTRGAVADSVMIFETLIEDWRWNPHSMQQSRAWMGSAVIQDDQGLGNDFLIALGGTSDGATPMDRFGVFNPLFGTWHTWPAMPTARMSLSTVVHEGKVYAFGGFTGPSGVTDKAEVYSLVYEHWSEIAPMPLPRGGSTADVVNGFVYIIGGATAASSPYNIEASKDVQVLNPWRCAP
ncbi:MAG: hypothetical protein GY835_25895 [bacterium]|nr:hypothetical protein [bacterium]